MKINSFFSSEISKNNHSGNPLDVMTIDLTTQKFYTDITDEDFKNLEFTFDKECVTFLKETFLYKNKIYQKTRISK